MEWFVRLLRGEGFDPVDGCSWGKMLIRKWRTTMVTEHSRQLRPTPPADAKCTPNPSKVDP